MQLATMLRYGLWAAIVATANANRRHYHMTTTWLPHLFTNTLTLLLPDLFRLVETNETPVPATPLVENVRVARNTLGAIVREPQYAACVTPLAMGYLLSHPDFNIYKGSMAELNIGGFGLDAIPHSTTAFAFATLACEATRIKHGESDALLARLLRWGSQRPALFSAGALALATLFWEAGEYRIYRHEIKLRGNTSQINMQWSVQDTLFDCFSNAIGWAMAMVWQRAQKR